MQETKRFTPFPLEVSFALFSVLLPNCTTVFAATKLLHTQKSSKILKGSSRIIKVSTHFYAVLLKLRRVEVTGEKHHTANRRHYSFVIQLFVKSLMATPDLYQRPKTCPCNLRIHQNQAWFSCCRPDRCLTLVDPRQIYVCGLILNYVALNI